MPEPRMASAWASRSSHGFRMRWGTRSACDRAWGGAACSASHFTMPTKSRLRAGSLERSADGRSGVVVAGEQAVGARVMQRLGAALDAQTTEQAPQVHLDRVLADVEFGRD